MKIGNVLAIAAAMLGNESLSKKIKLFLSEGATFTDEENEEISKLLSGYNITVSELNDEFFPLTHEEDLTSADGRFFFSDFAFRPVEVRAVYRDGVEVPYTHHPTYISAGYNNITVLYEYLLTRHQTFPPLAHTLAPSLPTGSLPRASSASTPLYLVCTSTQLCGVTGT